MSPLIVLVGLAIVALVLGVTTWRKGQRQTRSDASADAGDASVMDDGMTAPSVVHGDSHCAHASADSSGGDCGSDGGGSGD